MQANALKLLHTVLPVLKMIHYPHCLLHMHMTENKVFLLIFLLNFKATLNEIMWNTCCTINSTICAHWYIIKDYMNVLCAGVAIALLVSQAELLSFLIILCWMLRTEDLPMYWKKMVYGHTVTHKIQMNIYERVSLDFSSLLSFFLKEAMYNTMPNFSHPTFL